MKQPVLITICLLASLLSSAQQIAPTAQSYYKAFKKTISMPLDSTAERECMEALNTAIAD
jgi:adenine-specific DNA methylase